MAHLIDKDALLAEIEKLIDKGEYYEDFDCGMRDGINYALDEVKEKIKTLEVKDLYEQFVQYDSIKTGIQAHAETYSFNIESELFNQLTKEQQKLWRKEIEQACISGGEAGVELARDTRYKENLEVKEVDLEKEINKELETRWRGEYLYTRKFRESAKHFFELGMAVRNKTQKGE